MKSPTHTSTLHRKMEQNKGKYVAVWLLTVAIINALAYILKHL